MGDSIRASSAVKEWIAAGAIRFSADSLPAAIDQLMAGLPASVQLLGFGEALHGGEEILQLRNRFFQHLVEHHHFTALALESSLTGGRLVNDFVLGKGDASYERIEDAGFDNNFGRLDANRELIEWMRAYNTNHAAKLHFYGMDMPVDTWAASPRQTLLLVLDYLEAHDKARPAEKHLERRERIIALLGPDAPWENPAVFQDPSLSMGHAPALPALRTEVEDLITDLRTRDSEWIAATSEADYLEALQYARIARQLLNNHAAVARQPGADTLLGIRDVVMADNLKNIVARESPRGKILAFAHNAHLQRSKVVFPWYAFWPAGSHIRRTLGARYAAIGTALHASPENAISAPGENTLESLLFTNSDESTFILTNTAQKIPAEQLAGVPVRSGSTRNFSYTPIAPTSLTDFEAIAFLPTATYTRGQKPLPAPPRS